MDMNVDEIIEKGNLEDIEALFNSMSGASISDTEENLEIGDTEPAARQVVVPTGDTPSQEKEQTPVLRAKDGKHEIPFSVLEAERSEKAAIKSQLDALQRQNELLQAQLSENDIKPKELPENVRFSKEKLAELESYGEIGEAVAVLAQQNAALMARLQNQAPDAAFVEPTQPVLTDPDLIRWAEDDSQWAIAESIDSLIQKTPAWAGKSLQERIPEIVRRTKLELNEPNAAEIDARASAAVKAATPRVPNSLTDMGGEVPGSSRPVREQLEEADINDVQAYLEKQIASGKRMDDVLAALL